MKKACFQGSDGWLFCVLCGFGMRKINLEEILSRGDYLNRAIFTLEEINGGLSRLEQEGFIVLKSNRARLSKKAKQFYKMHRWRSELPIPEQVRFQEIFSSLPLSKEIVEKEYFTPAEYEAARQKYLDGFNPFGFFNRLI